MESRQTLLDRLENTAARLVETFQLLPDPDRMVYEGWSTRDILAHLTFWHESFARNLQDLANGRKPSPLKGLLSSLNQSSVEDMRSEDLQTILRRFQAAQQAIRENILNPDLLLIPYRRGSRDYTPEEHLSIVDEHINQHLRDIRKANQNSLNPQSKDNP